MFVFTHLALSVNVEPALKEPSPIQEAYDSKPSSMPTNPIALRTSACPTTMARFAKPCLTYARSDLMQAEK